MNEVQEEEVAKPKHLEIVESNLGVVFQLKMWHLFLFTMLPEASLNSSNTTLNLKAEEREALPNSRVSSANKERFMVFIPFAILSPVIALSFL